jgi:hypothetical protein
MIACVPKQLPIPPVRYYMIYIRRQIAAKHTKRMPGQIRMGVLLPAITVAALSR